MGAIHSWWIAPPTIHACPRLSLRLHIQDAQLDDAHLDHAVRCKKIGRRNSVHHLSHSWNHAPLVYEKNTFQNHGKGLLFTADDDAVIGRKEGIDLLHD